MNTHSSHETAVSPLTSLNNGILSSVYVHLKSMSLNETTDLMLFAYQGKSFGFLVSFDVADITVTVDVNKELYQILNHKFA